MLDLGFSEHVEEILARCSGTSQIGEQNGTAPEKPGESNKVNVDNAKRKLQILMFSATLPSWVQGPSLSFHYCSPQVIRVVLTVVLFFIRWQTSQSDT